MCFFDRLTGETHEPFRAQVETEAAKRKPIFRTQTDYCLTNFVWFPEELQIIPHLVKLVLFSASETFVFDTPEASALVERFLERQEIVRCQKCIPSGQL